MAVKQAEDSSDIIVRLVELSGQPQAQVQLTFAVPILAAQEVNGQEQPLGDAKFQDSTLIADFTPYQLRTYAVTLGQPAVKLAAQTSQPVALPYNASVASHDEQVATEGFDPDRRCLAAEMLPAG